MFYLFLFIVSAYGFLDLLFSQNPKWSFNLEDWKKTEGVIFKIISQEDSVFEVRFVTETLEWITAIPTAYSFNSINGPFEGDKVTIFYNSKNPKEFSINSTWLIRNSVSLKWLFIIINLGITLFSSYQIIETGFADKLLIFLGF